MTERKSVKQAANRVLQLEQELESAGTAATQADDLAFAHDALHAWVETVVGVVTSPGVGRVTLIHRNGSQTKIASPELPFLLSKPVRFSS